MEIKLDHGPLHYMEKGAGRPYVLLNGMPFGSEEYTDVLEVLSWSSRAIAFDLPGVGASAPMPDPTPAALAEALFFAFAKFGIDSFVLSATDIGGPVACEIIKKQAGLVAGLFLYNTCISAKGIRLPGYLKLSWVVGDLFKSRKEMENEILAMTGKGERLNEGVLEKGAANLGRASRKQGAKLYERMLEAPFEEYRNALKMFRKPVELLWGYRDPIFPVSQFREFRSILPQAGAHFDGETGHFLGIEKSDLMALRLQDLGRQAWC